MKALSVLVDGKIAGTFNIVPTSTVWFLLNEGVKLLDPNSVNSYKVTLNITPIGPSVPTQVFSDPRYKNTTIESLYHQMDNPTLLFTISEYPIELPANFQVTYKLIPRVPISPEDAEKVYHFSIDSLYRGHSFTYFGPDSIYIYERDTDGSIKMTSLLYRNDETSLLYKEPPSVINDITDYTTEAGINIIWDATLVAKEVFTD